MYLFSYMYINSYDYDISRYLFPRHLNCNFRPGHEGAQAHGRAGARAQGHRSKH